MYNGAIRRRKTEIQDRAGEEHLGEQFGAQIEVTAERVVSALAVIAFGKTTDARSTTANERGA